MSENQAQDQLSESRSSGGFSGDTTTFWDEVAVQEVLAAEEELRATRWQSFVTTWEARARAREERVIGIHDVESLLAYVGTLANNPASFEISTRPVGFQPMSIVMYILVILLPTY